MTKAGSFRLRSRYHWT